MNKHILGSILVAILGGCASISEMTSPASSPVNQSDSQPQIPINSPEIKAPNWVLKGGGALTGGKEDRFFYGVGSAAGIEDTAIARATADDRARNDLAKMISFDTKSLNKDYSFHRTAGDSTAITDEQHIETVITTLTASTVAGIVIVDHWEHPRRNEIFSLAKLDLDWFKRNVDKYNELSKDIRNAVKEKTDKLHRDLEEDLLKRKGALLERERRQLDEEREYFDEHHRPNSHNSNTPCSIQSELARQRGRPCRNN